MPVRAGGGFYRKLARLIQVLAHQYYRVDLEIVWNSVGEIPKLQSGVSAILADLPAA